MDLIFSTVTVIDGSGAPAYPADVVIRDGHIHSIQEPGTAQTRDARVINGEGLCLSPGFIDMHAHSDLQILVNREHPSRLSQGVTTEVLGQDGLSYAPVDDAVLAQLRTKIAGWNDDPVGFDWNWRTVGEYLERLDAPDQDGQRIATNAAYLIPQGTVRAMVLGFNPGKAGEEDLQRMEQLVRDGMEQGAVGMSSGLTYTPGMYADDTELARLTRVVGEYGGFYAPHHRSYGKGALAAYAEMISLTASTGCALHLAHATMNFDENKGRAQELLDLIDAALENGSDITLDTYPYLPGATTLEALLPSWASAGGPDASLARLADPESRARIRQAMTVEGSDGCHGVTVDWDTIQISGVRHPDLDYLVGQRVSDIAAAQGQDGFDAFADLLIRDRCGTGILQHVGHEENVRAIMQHSTHTGGSDGLLVGARPHPRAWGTFARYLGHYVRQEELLSLTEMVHHLTGRPAERLKLERRGYIRQGYAADLVLFDPERIGDAATYQSPRLPAEGITAVVVNGLLALDQGKLTGIRAGRALVRNSQGKATPRD